MQNHVGLTRKYASANLTARDWCKRRKPAEQVAPRPAETGSTPIDPDALFGYTQSAADGLAQARNSPEYQRYLAEEAQKPEAIPLPAVNAKLQHAA